MQSFRLDENLKDSISVNGFGKRDMLKVIFNIYDNGNESTERELHPLDYLINGVPCPPFWVDVKKFADIPVYSRVVALFTKHREYGQKYLLDRNTSFYVWATNRSNIEVAENNKENDDIKSAISWMINDSPEFEMTFIGPDNCNMSLAEWKIRVVEGFPIPSSYSKRDN